MKGWISAIVYGGRVENAIILIAGDDNLISERCKICRYQASVTAGTIMYRSHLNIYKHGFPAWFFMFIEILYIRKGLLPHSVFVLYYNYPPAGLIKSACP